MPVTLSCTIYKYEALLRRPEVHGRAVFADVARRWGGMLFAGATSLWETEKGAWDFDNAGSLCHGWSAVPVYLYYAYALGWHPEAAEPAGRGRAVRAAGRAGAGSPAAAPSPVRGGGGMSLIDAVPFLEVDDRRRALVPPARILLARGQVEDAGALLERQELQIRLTEERAARLYNPPAGNGRPSCWITAGSCTAACGFCARGRRARRIPGCGSASANRRVRP